MGEGEGGGEPLQFTSTVHPHPHPFDRAQDRLPPSRGKELEKRRLPTHVFFSAFEALTE